MHLLQVIVEFLIVLGFMVLVHEFGHFAMAKAFRVRVEAFAIGFGTRLFGVHHGGTDYRVNALPFGGYVKFAGDQPGEAPADPADFNAHPRWQRVLIALAGPVANFLLALFLLTLVAHFHHEVGQYLNNAAVVDYVPAHSQAATAGVQSGDTIQSLNGRQTETWLNVLTEGALRSNQSVPLTWTQAGQLHTGTIRTPSLEDGGAGSGEEVLADLGLYPREQTAPITVKAVAADSPAAAAGLQPGDQVLRVDSFQPHGIAALLAYLKDRAGAPSVLTIQRDGQVLPLPITPRQMPTPGTSQPTYRLGFEALRPPIDVVHLPWGQATAASAKDNAEDSTLILRVLKGMFTRQVAVKSVSGPVGMAQMIDVAAQDSKWTLLRLMSSISINLGIMNLLPFPILDGGMILFLLIEAVMRRDVNQAIKERVYQVAFVCLILFAVFVMFNDITKLHLKL